MIKLTYKRKYLKLTHKRKYLMGGLLTVLGSMITMIGSVVEVRHGAGAEAESLHLFHKQ